MFILKGRAGILWEAIGCHEHNVKNLRGPEESKAKKKKKERKTNFVNLAAWLGISVIVRYWC